MKCEGCTADDTIDESLAIGLLNLMDNFDAYVCIQCQRRLFAAMLAHPSYQEIKTCQQIEAMISYAVAGILEIDQGAKDMSHIVSRRVRAEVVLNFFLRETLDKMKGESDE